MSWIFEPYEIGMTKGDLVEDRWNNDVGLVTGILWGKPNDELLPTWVTVLWSGEGKESGCTPDCLKKVEESS